MFSYFTYGSRHPSGFLGVSLLWVLRDSSINSQQALPSPVVSRRSEGIYLSRLVGMVMAPRMLIIGGLAVHGYGDRVHKCQLARVSGRV
jgi:hypothetical protein